MTTTIKINFWRLKQKTAYASIKRIFDYCCPISRGKVGIFSHYRSYYCYKARSIGHSVGCGYPSLIAGSKLAGHRCICAMLRFY